MSSKRLGKGINAIINPTSKKNANPSNRPSVNRVKINNIKPNPNQPRRDFDKKSLEELSLSIKSKGVITPINEIQGESESSPYEGQFVNTAGIVTGAFANSFYIQDGSEPWSGIYIYSGGALPSIGDSVIVSGQISEFCWNGSPCDCSSCGGAGVTEFYQPDDI